MTAHALAHPFSAPHWKQIHQLLDGLDDRQAFWLSGYLAARAPADNPTLTPSAGNLVLIGFGTETDNCRALAHRLAEQCRAVGIDAQAQDLGQVRLRQLAKREYLVIITATHGDGDPPEPIVDFYQALMGEQAPTLEGIKFAVLALGDSSYERFCVTGQEIDARLEALGGQRLIDRQDCDVDFQNPAKNWMARLLESLPKSRQATPASATPAAPAVADGYSKARPLTTEVLVNQNLSGAHRQAPIHHLELALDDPAFTVAPGDAVGILADNPPRQVAAVLDALELSGEEPVTVQEQALPLVQALRQYCDLTIPGSAFLKSWAELTGDATLTTVVEAGTAEQRAFLKRHQVLDLLRRYPAHPDAQTLVDTLRPLQPRLYDVANSLAAIDDELHLTVKRFQYDFEGRRETGVASRYLLDLQPGDSVRLYPHANTRFRLPDDANLPVILIAEGTGIAPYRAFFQALAAESRATPCWLVFAEHHFEDDFLYQLELQQARTDGHLERIDTVFQDQHPGRALADPLLEQSDELLRWLDRGAHLYLCGDKARLTEVEKALQERVDGQLGQGHWKQLSKAKRLHRNLY
ncbi:diflavin oxidoreductase [Alloalcanivorax mobilis]|uniref:diflavin oxidoreductase n=1 Tax=Alloalcanivorax mobilis TaxID=2019569 RepID=UPI000C75DBB3|nr:sulfite reductase flavoprotein subunit alpha [Alloalcanivorax mobilis]